MSVLHHGHVPRRNGAAELQKVMGVEIQAYVVIFILALFLGSHSLTRPFANEALNSLETYSLGFSFCTLYLGLLFYNDNFNTFQTGVIVLSGMIIAMNILFVLKTIKHLAKHFAGEGCSMVLSSLGNGLIFQGVKWCYSLCCFLKKEEEQIMEERKRRKSHQKLTAVAPTAPSGKKGPKTADAGEKAGETWVMAEQGQGKEEQDGGDGQTSARSRRVTMHTQAVENAIHDAEAVKEYEARQQEKNREKLQKRIESRAADNANVEQAQTEPQAAEAVSESAPALSPANPGDAGLPVAKATGENGQSADQGEHGQSADQSVTSPVPEPAADLTLDDLKAVRQKHGGNSGEYKDFLAKYKKQEMEKAKKKLQAKKSYRQGKK